jgi:hypothetical protein
MKKFAVLLAVIIFTGISATSFAQKNRTLSKGFSINLIAGIPSTNYGLPSDSHIDSEDKYGLLGGLQIGSRWYFSPSDKFGVGLMVNWFDITAAFKSTTNSLYTMARVTVDFSLLEVGPVATLALTDDFAVDAYYNLRPTGLATVFAYSSDSGDYDESEGYAGFGISHAVGTAFRWKVLSIGAEYVVGKIKCEDTDTETTYEPEKFMLNNFRIMLGVKF